MKKRQIYLPKDKLVEYNGDLYTPEELAKKFELKGDIEIIVTDEETWFSKAIEAIPKIQ